MKTALLQLHIAVFLWGFTGVLGKTIQLNEGLLVWYRLLFTIFFLLIIAFFKNQSFKISVKKLLQLAGIGSIVALHWVLFYGSIKYSNVSIALTCLASSGVMTAFLEPLFFKKKLRYVEVLLGSIALLAIYLIFHFDVHFRTGIILGLLSALASVTFSILNKKIVAHTAPNTIMLYELSGGLLFLTLLMPFYFNLTHSSFILPNATDAFWLIVLSVVCTVWAMQLSLKALKHISAFTQNLTLNLEPVYGIILAFIIYKENKQLSSNFYIGLVLIIATVALQSVYLVKSNMLKQKKSFTQTS
jgi:drug/metabolite transporter (DMT)-like permease